MRSQKFEGGKYVVYEDGRIWSQFKNDWSSTTKRKDGYVGFSYRNISGKRCCKTLHRVVYETLNGPIPRGLEINHKDGDKTNNSLINLEAVTSSQNKKHAFAMGLRRILVGSDIARTKLSESDVREIRRLFAEGLSRTFLARKFKVSYPTIHRILSRKRRSYIE